MWTTRGLRLSAPQPRLALRPRAAAIQGRPIYPRSPPRPHQPSPLRPWCPVGWMSLAPRQQIKSRVLLSALWSLIFFRLSALFFRLSALRGCAPPAGRDGGGVRRVVPTKSGVPTRSSCPVRARQQQLLPRQELCPHRVGRSTSTSAPPASNTGQEKAGSITLPVLPSGAQALLGAVSLREDVSRGGAWTPPPPPPPLVCAV